MDNNKKISRLKHWIVLGILVLSLAIRWVLVLRGGQFYFPDEFATYSYASGIAQSFIEKNYPLALRDLTAGAGHFGFRAVAVLPAMAEIYFNHLPKISGVFFSTFSVISLYLIWRIAIRIGASNRESMIALVLAASSHSLLYFSRHLLPYDLALFFGLWALFVGLGRTPDKWKYFACGLLGSMCFITYNGYWPLAGFALVAPLFAKKNVLAITKITFWVFIGFCTPFLVMAILFITSSNINPIYDYINFANSVVQGSYSEGWSLPFEYFWHTEYFLLIILAVFGLNAIINSSIKSKKAILFSGGGFLFIYLCLAIPSSILGFFVVYGRLARQLIPFLILLASQGFVVPGKKYIFSRLVISMILLAVGVQSAFNYHRSYVISYPREFIQEAKKQYPNFKISQKRTNTGAPFICKHKNYVAINVKFIFPAPKSLPDVQEGVLLSVPHPVNFLPYQYEGYSPEERGLFRDLETRMELIEFNEEAQAIEIFGALKNCVATRP